MLKQEVQVAAVNAKIDAKLSRLNQKIDSKLFGRHFRTQPSKQKPRPRIGFRKTG